MTKTYKFYVLSWRVIDGDTVEFTLDLGHRLSLRIPCRLARINAEEGKVTSASQWLIDRLLLANMKIEVQTLKLDKFGRQLVEVFAENTQGESSNLNTEMLSIGLVRPYSKD